MSPIERPLERLRKLRAQSVFAMKAMAASALFMACATLVLAFVYNETVWLPGLLALFFLVMTLANYGIIWSMDKKLDEMGVSLEDASQEEQL